MEDLIIRSVKSEDSERIWQIRNHPLIRQQSGSQEEIPFEKHNLWFKKKYFSGDNNLCFVLEKENKVVGYCRFDSDDKGCCIISIALDYDHQGKGLGHLLLSESLQKFERNIEILATVKKGNIASLKLFQKNNFKLDKEDEENFYLKQKKKLNK